MRLSVGLRLLDRYELAGSEVKLVGTLNRELEVLGLVAEGLSDREIAERLVLSPHTVHRHASNILAKLGESSRTAAVAHAARQGLL